MFRATECAAYLEHHRAVNDSSHGRQVTHSGTEQSVDAGFLCHIATAKKDIGASSDPQVVHQLLHLS